MTLEQRFRTSLETLLAKGAAKRIGIAISGGGDSTALLALVTDWAAQNNCQVYAATVDHGLRPEAAAEAAQVASFCQSIGVEHQVLAWTGWDERGNLQAHARRARYELLDDWAARHDITQVLLGHTEDDQAETFLMRLSRGSGVDGLSAMSPIRQSGAISYLRPLLAVTRDDLRTYLKGKGISWIDDPSNQDERFDRIKTRRVLAGLSELGIEPAALAASAMRLQSARKVLARVAHDAARRLVSTQAGAVFLETTGFGELEAETRRRLLAHLLQWVGQKPYPPRASALEVLENAIAQGQGGTLHGCLVLNDGNSTVICREPDAVSHIACNVNDLWDNQWRVMGPGTPEFSIRITGETGLLQCLDWRAVGLPRSVLIASPAVWQGDTLIAAPIAGFSNGWQAEWLLRENDLFRSLLSH